MADLKKYKSLIIAGGSYEGAKAFNMRSNYPHLRPIKYGDYKGSYLGVRVRC